MANIFNIQQDLFTILATIEENDGELTPELEQQLSISYDELKSKVKSYTDAIKSLELDLVGIKEEQNRLKNLKSSKEHTINHLKEILAEAIENFGDTSKSGTKFIDYGTGKVSIRKSDSIEVDTDVTKELVNRVMTWFNWRVYDNSIDEELTNSSLLDYCNKGNGDDTQFNITKDDLDNLQTDLTLRLNLKDIVNNNEAKQFIKQLYRFTQSVSSTPVVDKLQLKNNIKAGVCDEEGNPYIPSFATYSINDNVVIK